MGRKGESTGLKRRPAPSFWPIQRKKFTWVVKPSPGPHSVEGCLPLAVVLRDILGFAKSEKEAKMIVSKEKVLIDGAVRREDRFPVGLLDVISLPEADKHYCVLPSKDGLMVHPVTKEEASFKLCRVENKKVLEDGNIQLNLHDGTNLFIKVADPKNPQEDMYETLETLKLSLPDKQVLEQIKNKEKNCAIITGGKNAGKFGKISEIEKATGKKRRMALATVEDEAGNKYQTILDLVFPIGQTKPLITMPEERPNV